MPIISGWRCRRLWNRYTLSSHVATFNCTRWARCHRNKPVFSESPSFQNLEATRFHSPENLPSTRDWPRISPAVLHSHRDTPRIGKCQCPHRTGQACKQARNAKRKLVQAASRTSSPLRLERHGLCPTSKLPIISFSTLRFSEGVFVSFHPFIPPMTSTFLSFVLPAISCHRMGNHTPDVLEQWPS